MNAALPSPVATLQADLAARGVRHLFAQFADIHGTPRGKLVPLAHLESLLSVGAGFAGPSIWGTALPRHGVSSEYYGRGDASTLMPMPWAPGQARIVCDGFVAGAPFARCPRQLLRRQIARLAERGLTLNAGIEPEFFLLRRAADGALLPFDADDVLEKPSYDVKSLARAQDIVLGIADALAACGLDVFQIDHEDASGQYEINWRYAGALQAADELMLFKVAAHAIAERHGAIFSMMPKPFADRPGSGLHLHLSLADAAGGAPLADPRDPRGQGLSATGYAFLGGLLHHAPALAALCAPTVNSYKRLVVGQSLSGTTWAPAFIAYGDNNRTALARTVAGRLEWRLPDAAANPYVMIAAVIAAGLDGIDRGLDPGAAHDEDLYELDAQARIARGIRTLPQHLGEAVAALRADAALCAALGDDFCAEFVRLKESEWIEFSRAVHTWELDRYATRF